VGAPLPAKAVRQARAHHHRATHGIEAAIDNGLSDARIEQVQVNATIRLITPASSWRNVPPPPRSSRPTKSRTRCSSD
jgi:hypothetical protein